MKQFVKPIYVLFRNQLGKSRSSAFRNLRDEQFLMELLQYKTWWELEADDTQKRHTIARQFLSRVKPPQSLR